MTPHRECLEISCSHGSGLKIKAKGLIYICRSPYQEIAIYDTDPYGRCLFLDGVIQSSESDHEEYDKAILRKLKHTDKNLLVLGGGDGHTANMALRLNPRVQVTVVELDRTVISACEVYLNQEIFDHPNVHIVIDDAIHFMQTLCNVSYDIIICDLTDQPLGYNGILLETFYSKVFSLSARLLNHSGWISAYGGCNADVLANTTNSRPSELEKHVVSISSFGEPCFFVHHHVLNENLTRGGKL